MNQQMAEKYKQLLNLEKAKESIPIAKPALQSVKPQQFFTSLQAAIAHFRPYYTRHSVTQFPPWCFLYDPWWPPHTFQPTSSLQRATFHHQEIGRHLLLPQAPGDRASLPRFHAHHH
ncbi:hypothetical protein FGO68_gene16875 [Halteria grandinella]|uniref:Uncharacterized protein n=1 Tax=Halteria grandinella TaxID=5974 RepID=A0A8J8SVH5_HALGN|nr:hypothetical protein FGO68_gene16875 [Halteria grandinella]